MTKVWRWLKKWWWTLLVALGVVLGFLVRGLFSGRGDGGSDEKPPNFKERAEEQVKTIEAETLLEKAKVKATADVQRAQLEQIEKIEDVRERRKQLAAFLESI